LLATWVAEGTRRSHLASGALEHLARLLAAEEVKE